MYPATGASTRTSPAAAGHGHADADADEGGEERVRERADQAADDEGRGQRLGAARPQAVGAVVGGGQVEDVLHEREPDADHAGVDEAVEHPVQLSAPPPQQEQQEEPLGRLLGHRRDHGEHVAVVEAAEDPAESPAAPGPRRWPRTRPRPARTPAAAGARARSGRATGSSRPAARRAGRPAGSRRPASSGAPESRMTSSIATAPRNARSVTTSVKATLSRPWLDMVRSLTFPVGRGVQ